MFVDTSHHIKQFGYGSYLVAFFFTHVRGKGETSFKGIGGYDVGGRRMCSSGMMLWEVTVWVMLLSITALPVGDWMKTCLFTAMYTIAIPQGMV